MSFFQQFSASKKHQFITFQGLSLSSARASQVGSSGSRPHSF